MTLTGSYAMHEVFVAPARPHAQLWRLIAGILLASLSYIALGAILFSGDLPLAGAGWRRISGFPVGRRIGRVDVCSVV